MSAVGYFVTRALRRRILPLTIEKCCDSGKEILKNVNNIEERPGIEANTVEQQSSTRNFKYC